MSNPVSSIAWNRAGQREDGTPSGSPLPISSTSLFTIDSPQPNPQSRRQRLLGLARATRDIYIPKIASVAQLAANSATRAPQMEFDEFGLPLTFPKGTVITLFPSFTKPIEASQSPTSQGGYLVSVRGWMWCPGLMSRKNRLVLSLAKQLTKGGGEDMQQKAMDRLTRDSDSIVDSNSSDTESFSSSTLAEETSSEQNSVDSLIKERLSSFIATSIAKASLNVVIGSEESDTPHDLVESLLYTDGRGHFVKEIFVPYKPSIVQVNATADESVYSFQEINIVSPAGLGIISDIDDTVKHTGVIGDKRELMSRLLVGQISSWNIPVVVKWYQDMLANSGATFHYVSNSPWQLYNIIDQYFESVNLPRGSIHLKQYSGNIIASLREPSTSRKKTTLSKILQDFPEKKFICIGDSGEHDFEAYVDLAKAFPNRIMAIYVRAVPGSFSLIDDSHILQKLQWMTAEWKKRKAAKMSSKQNSSVSLDNLIDLDLDVDPKAALLRAQRLPPLVPKKPASLKGEPLAKTQQTDEVETPPPVPPRRRTPMDGDRSVMIDKATIPKLTPTQYNDDDRPPPPPPRRHETRSRSPELQTQLRSKDFRSQSPDARNGSFDNLNTLHGVNDEFELEEVDEKGAMWIQKLSVALHELDCTDTDIAFFEDSDKDFFKSSLDNLKVKATA